MTGSALGRRVRVVGFLIALGVLAAFLLLLLSVLSGRILVNEGYGYDGQYYVKMMQSGFSAGTPSMRLRPLVLVINRAVDSAVFHDPLRTFRAMNFVYAGMLAIGLSVLCLQYGATHLATTVLIISLFLSISVSKMFAFYPTIVDLGAYAVITFAVCAVVLGRRGPIAITTVLAVVSREFGAAVVLFGIVRDRRLGRSVLATVVTFAPAVMAFFWIRSISAHYSTAQQLKEPVLSLSGVIGALLTNVRWWSDPLFVIFSVYFVVTLFGGVSLFLLATRRPLAHRLRQEPEWLAIVVPILAAGALGPFDMWRYWAYMIPAIPVFWSWSLSAIEPRRRGWLFAAVVLATLATQRPWHRMDRDPSYFRDWFPYYLVINDPESKTASLWPVWGVYLSVAAASWLGVAAVARWARVSRLDTVAPS